MRMRRRIEGVSGTNFENVLRREGGRVNTRSCVTEGEAAHSLENWRLLAYAHTKCMDNYTVSFTVTMEFVCSPLSACLDSHWKNRIISINVT